MRWNQSQWFFTLNCKYLCVYVRAHTATYDLFLEYVQRLHPFHHFPSSLPPFPLCFHVFQWTEWLGEGEENETAPQLILSLLVYSNCIPCYNRYQNDICFAALPSFLFLSRYLPHISSLSYHMYRDKCEPAPFFPFFDFFTSPYFSFQSCTYENGETLRSNTEMQNRIRDTQKSDRRTNRQLHLSMITYIHASG